MSSNLHGFSNEKNISDYLNNKIFKHLNENMKQFISFLFCRQISNEENISSGLTSKIGRKNPKPDIWVEIANEKKYISIKEGSGNSVHQEKFSEFCDFLKQIKIPDAIINYLKLYHYGDDTLDGNGEIRLKTSAVKKKYSEEIKSFNSELNQPHNLSQILNRFLFSGAFDKPIIVDAVYHGTINEGFYANREEIINFLMKNISIDAMPGIQFSKLTYQPWTRDPSRTAAHPERRHEIQIKWDTMTNCIKMISKER